ncbi:sporulation histidine kinase inhibitor Sda [Oceanobacillus damuensis]|nr:sporulation histidine kinase inhibitor Sda [Oceanobacillus damuensis]
MESLNTLSDELLMEAYQKAQELRLDEDFINLLERELEKRSGNLDKK